MKSIKINPNRQRFCKIFVLDVLHDFFKAGYHETSIQANLICVLVDSFYEMFYPTLSLENEKEKAKKELFELCKEEQLSCDSFSSCSISEIEKSISPLKEKSDSSEKLFRYFDTCLIRYPSQIISPIQTWESRIEPEKEFLVKGARIEINSIAPNYHPVSFIYNSEAKNAPSLALVLDEHYTVFEGSDRSMAFGKKMMDLKSGLEEYYKRLGAKKEEIKITKDSTRAELNKIINLLVSDFSVIADIKNFAAFEEARKFCLKKLIFTKFAKDFAHCAAALQYSKSFDRRVEFVTKDRLLKVLAADVFGLIVESF